MSLGSGPEWPVVLRPKKLRGVGWWTTFAVLSAFLAFHFSAVLLYVLPQNPISYEYAQGINNYIRPIFTQNWRLFAPEPPYRDINAYVRGNYSQAGVEAQTEWLPLTEQLVTAVQQNRLTRLSRVRTTLYEAVYSVLNTPGLNDPSPEVRQALAASWADVNQQPAGLVVVERAGAAALAARYPTILFRQVQVMISIRTLPSFSNRTDADEGGPTTSLTVVPVPFEIAAGWPRT